MPLFLKRAVPLTDGRQIQGVGDVGGVRVCLRVRKKIEMSHISPNDNVTYLDSLFKLDALDNPGAFVQFGLCILVCGRAFGHLHRKKQIRAKSRKNP